MTCYRDQVRCGTQKQKRSRRDIPIKIETLCQRLAGDGLTQKMMLSEEEEEEEEVVELLEAFLNWHRHVGLPR